MLTQNFRKLAFKQKAQLRSYIGIYPELFFPIINLKKNSRKLAVNGRTEIVIEGFPRSANSFAEGAFRYAQPQQVNTATHLHVPAQVILACRKNIPTLVVIRKPIDAVVSLAALELECKSKIGADTTVSLYDFELMFKSYIIFYKSIFSYHNKFVLSSFEETTKDFASIISKINSRFGTNFAEFEHTEANVQKVFTQQGFHAGPSVQRKQLKKILRQEIKASKYLSIITQAEEVYQHSLLLSRQTH